MTSVTMEWESRLGRRLRVRDLYILATVVKAGGMAKAARQLALTQPAVSAAIANLEHLLGVRLLDRSPRGIEPTIYAEALLKRSVAVFDELKHSVKDVQSLVDPATGELRIGCPLNTTILPQFIERFSKRYPRVTVHVHHVPSPALRNPGLRDRKYDLVVARLGPSLPNDQTTDDLKLEQLFDDPLVVAVGLHSKWARRRTVDLEELLDEPWCLTHPDAWNYIGISEAYLARGLPMPKVSLSGFSMPLVNHFVANGPFITAMPCSVARYCSLKVLPVGLPKRPWPVVIATLKNRTLSPVVERFIECARDVAKTLAAPRKSQAKQRPQPRRL
jgi:DNA-binding transcriptional LysR family regulator